MTSMTSVSGSNETINEAAGCSISLSGSNDVVNVAGSGYVGLISGSGDTIDMSNGSVDTVNNITGLVINGSNDVVGAGAGDSINVNGSNDVVDMANGGYVGLVSGTGDSVNMSNGGLDTVNYVYNITLNGSNDIIGAGVGDTINVNGSNDTIQMAGGGYLGLTGGSGDTVFMTGGTLATVYNVTNISLHGSNDLISTGAGCSISIYGNNNNADMLTIGYVGNIEGNNNQANIGNSGYVGNVIGSNNSITIGTGSYVGLVSGSTNTLFMNNCTVCTLNYITNVALNGYGDIVAMGNSCSIAINGNDDSVSLGSGGTAGIIAGISDSVTISGGIVNMLSNIPGMFLYGSSNTLSAGTGDQINVMGSSNSITAGASSYVGIGSGGGNTINVGTGSIVYLATGTGNNVNMSGGNLGSANNITGYALIGSNDTASLGSGASVNVVGNNDVITVGASSYVGVIHSSAVTVNMTGGTIDTLDIVTNITVNGSNNNIGTGANDSFNLNGNGDTLNMGTASTAGTIFGNSNTINIGAGGNIMDVAGNSNNLTVGAGGYIGIVGGNANTANISGGTLDTLSNVTNTTLNGSNNNIGLASGNQIGVTGNGNVLNVATGDTVTLGASDSGDVINGYGVNVVAAAGVSGITVNGFNNVVSGAGAAAVTLAPSIPILISYFEANPYLSQDQIQAVENNPKYSAALETYLSSANLYGSPNALPSNVLAMLDGYSAVYTALAGVPTEIFSEAGYIEQQFGWAEQNYPMPATIQVEGNIEGMGSILQNLMPVLESTNTATQSLVSEALNLLEYGNAGAPAGNQTPMLSDSTAEMLLAIAESPGFSAATQSSTEVYTPGRSGHWEIVVNGNGTYTQTFKSPPLIETVLSDLDTYVAPIIDIASVLCLNPEFITLTGLSSAVATGVEVAATAINLTQAGQDFAAGDDLQGVLGVIEAVGGAFQEIGKAEGVPIGACSTTNGLQQFGEALSEGGAVAQGIDGVVAGAQSGNILAAITSGLGGVAGVAGLANDSTIQQYAAVGEELGSTALAAQRGDILAALDGLVQGAATSGVLTQILQGIDALFYGYTEATYGASFTNDVVNPYSKAPLNEDTVAPGTQWGTGAYLGWKPGNWTPIYNSEGSIVGISYLDPTSDIPLADQENNAGVMASAQATANGIAYQNGAPTSFLIVGHGNPTGLYSNDEESQYNPNLPISAASVLATVTSLGIPVTASTVLLACNTAAPNSTSYTYNSLTNQEIPTVINGNAPGVDFAQTYSDLSKSAVIAFDGYADSEANGNLTTGYVSTGAYVVDGSQQTAGETLQNFLQNVLASHTNASFSAYEATSGSPPSGSVIAGINGGYVELMTPNAAPQIFDSLPAILSTGQNAQHILWQVTN